MGIKLFKLFEADGQLGGRTDGRTDDGEFNSPPFLSTYQFISEFWGIM